MISVVIPYFQREPGVLRRALQSVASQDYRGNIEVIVVDDGSPAAVEPEIASVTFAPTISVRTIRQANRGPAAARNSALAALSHSTKYVALLDSDDTWFAEHIRRAVCALEAGHDVYFSDILGMNKPQSWMAQQGRDDVSLHTPLQGLPSAFRFEGNMFDQIITASLMNTSTVVFDARFAPDLRFAEDLFSAGEDQLYFLMLAVRGARFCFSSNCEAAIGRGVNIHQGVKRGTEASRIRLANEIRYRKKVLRWEALSTRQRKLLSKQLSQSRVGFLLDVLHSLRLGRRVDLAVMWRQAREDPKTFLAAGRTAIRVLSSLATRRIKGSGEL